MMHPHKVCSDSYEFFKQLPGGKALMGECCVAMTHYRLPSMEELTARYPELPESGGRFGWLTPGTVSSLFDGRPWERHASCATIDEKSGDRQFLLAEIPRVFRGCIINKACHDIAEYIAEFGFRFAIESELVSFGAEHRSSHYEKWVLAPGSFIYDTESTTQYTGPFAGLQRLEGWCPALGWGMGLNGGVGKRLRVLGQYSLWSILDSEVERLLLVRK